MHTRTDIMAILIYYVLFPLRFIVVIVLREDVHNVFYQIVYSKSEHRKSWVYSKFFELMIIFHHLPRFCIALKDGLHVHNFHYLNIEQLSKRLKYFRNWDLESDDRFTLVDGYSPFLKRTVIEQMIAEEQMSPIISAANSIRGSRD